MYTGFANVEARYWEWGTKFHSFYTTVAHMRVLKVIEAKHWLVIDKGRWVEFVRRRPRRT